MQPVTYNFPPILQGTEWNIQLQFFQDVEQTIPLNLTNYDVEMHVRSEPAAALAPTVIVALSSRPDGEGANRITFVDPSNGLIRLHLTSVETAEIEWVGGRGTRRIPAIVTYWYDIELINKTNNVVQRVMRGEWPFDAEITKQEV